MNARKYLIKVIGNQGRSEEDLNSGLDDLISMVGIPDDLKNLTHNSELLLKILTPFREFQKLKNVILLLDTIEEFTYKINDRTFDGSFPLKLASKRSPFSTKQYPFYLLVDRLARKHDDDDIRLFFAQAIIFQWIKNKSLPTSLIYELFFLLSDVEVDNKYQKLKADISKVTGNKISGFDFFRNLDVYNNAKGVETDIPNFDKFESFLNAAVSDSDLHNPDLGPDKTPDSSGNKSTGNRAGTRTGTRTGTGRMGTARETSHYLIAGVFEQASSVVTVQPERPDSDLLEGESIYEEAMRVEIFPAEVIDGETVSVETARSAAKAKRLKNAMKSQFLSTDWDRLTAYELNTITKECLVSLNESEGEQQLASFATLFTLVTGSEPLFWSYCRIGESEDEMWLDVERGVFGHPIMMEENHWRPSEQQVEKLESVKDTVVLPLESNIWHFLLSQNLKTGELLHEALGTSPEELDHIATDKVKALFKDQARWFTVARVRDFLYHNVMSLTLDQSLASHLCAQNIYDLPTSNSYVAFPASRLRKEYQRALPHGLKFPDQQASDDYLVGSKLQIKTSYLQSFIKTLDERHRAKVNAIQSRSTLTEVIEAHNALMDLFVFTLLVETSHRPNNDPFARRVDFVEAINGVLVTDKAVHQNNETRLSFYGDLTAQNFQTYLSHIKTFSYWCADFGLEIESAKLYSLTDDGVQPVIPFLFYANHDRDGLKFESVSKSKLTSRMEEFGLPWVFGRHLRATEFRKMGLPAEYIAYDMGHIGPGEQPFGTHSILTPKEVGNHISEKVSQLSATFGFKPILSLKFHRMKTRIPKERLSELKPVPLGYEKREQVRQKSQRSDHEIIKSIERDFFSDLSAASITQEQVEKALNRIYQRHPSNLLRTINLFTRLLRGYKQRYGLKHIKLPTKLIEIKEEKSTFNVGSAPLINKARKIREYLLFDHASVKANKPKPKKDQAIYLLIRLFHSIGFLSFVSDERLLKHALEAVYHQRWLYYEGQLYLDLEEKGQFYRRLPIDSVSAILVHEVVALKNHLKKSDFGLQTISGRINDVLHLPELKIANIACWKKLVRSLSKLYLPGVVYSSLDGTRAVATLNAPALVRKFEETKISHDKTRLEKAEDTLNKNQALEKLAVQLSDATPGHKGRFKHAKQCRSHIAKLLIQAKEKQSRKKALEMFQLGFDAEKSHAVTTPISQLLYLWVAHKIKSEGIRKKHLDFSTIKTDFHYIATGLIEKFIDQNPIKLDQEALLDCYQAIIDAKENNQDDTKRELLNFHKFLVAYFQVEDIDPMSLEAKISDNSALGIDANVLYEFEFERACDRLKAEKDGDVLQLILTLYYRLGCRPAELFKLRMKQCQVTSVQDESSLILDSKLYEKLKNLNSTRVLPLRLLTQDEYQTFYGYYELRRTQSGEHERLFSLEKDEALKAIFNTIEQVTGDETLSPRNLRHTFATQLVSSICLDATSYSNFAAKWFDCREKTRRALYQVASFMGHGAPSTALTHYTHNYDQMHAILVQDSLPNLHDQRLLKELVNTASDTTLRQWVKRYLDEFDGDRARVILARLFIKDASYGEIVIRYQYKPKIKRGPKLSLLKTHDQLFELAERSQTETSFDMEQLSHLKKLTFETGMDPYQIFSTNSEHQCKSLRLEREVSEELEHLMSLFEPVPAKLLKEVAKDWRQYRIVPYVYPQKESLLKIRKLCDLIGFKVECWVDPGKDQLQGFVPEGIEIKIKEGGSKKPFDAKVHPNYVLEKPTVMIQFNQKLMNKLLDYIFYLMEARNELYGAKRFNNQVKIRDT